MRILLTILGVLGLGFGGLIFGAAQQEQAGAIHEIEGLLCFLIGTCGLGFAGVIAAVRPISPVSHRADGTYIKRATDGTPIEERR